MEYAKSNLEKEIEEIFDRHTGEDRTSEVAGVVKGVLHEYFRQLATGN